MTGRDLYLELGDMDWDGVDLTLPIIIYDGYKEYTNFDICETDKAIWIEVHDDENS